MLQCTRDDLIPHEEKIEGVHYGVHISTLANSSNALNLCNSLAKCEVSGNEHTTNQMKKWDRRSCTCVGTFGRLIVLSNISSQALSTL